VEDNLQVSKGIPPKTKFKLKQLKAIGQHRGAQTMSTLMNVSSSKDEDDYTIMGTITEPMHEQNVVNLTHMRLVKISIHKSANILFT